MRSGSSGGHAPTGEGTGTQAVRDCCSPLRLLLNLLEREFAPDLGAGELLLLLAFRLSTRKTRRRPLLRTRRRHSCRVHARLASPHALPALVPLAKGIRADSLGILHSHLRRWYAGRALAGEVKVKTQSRECGWPLAAAGLIPGCQACLTSPTEKCTALPLTTPKVRYLHFSCKVFYMSSVNAMLIVVPGNSTGTAVVGPRLKAYPDVSGIAL